jgi:hypothetical protein
VSDDSASRDGRPPEGFVDSLLDVIALPLDDQRAARLSAALQSLPAELARLRDAAADDEPQVVFDPRWD